MKLLFIILNICVALLFSAASESLACSTFILECGDRHVFGRNYDWDLDDALIVVNKRGVRKTAFKRPGEKGEPLTWISRFGSVTFNQYGRERPTGGMNEAGLVVESMSLRATMYPPPDSRPYLDGTSQWKQYILDACENVECVISSDKTARISTASGVKFGVHFLVSDRLGGSAVIEFLNGKMKAYTGEDLPLKALTNSTYKKSLKSWSNRKTWNATWTGSSLNRFITVADMTENFDPARHPLPVKYAFQTLSLVTVGRTVWSIVYDDKDLTIHFFTRANMNLRSINMKDLDFSCQSPVLVMDINSGEQGDISGKFIPYTYELNRELIRSSFGKTSFLRNISSERQDSLARRPESNVCER